MATDPNSLENLNQEDAGLAKLMRDLAGGSHREEFLAVLKKNNPKLVIPELDVESGIEAAVKPLNEKIGVMENKFIVQSAEANVLRKRAELVKQGFSDDDITAIEKMMISEHIASHDTAAKFYKLQQASAQPTPSRLSVTQMPVGKKDIKEAGGINKWALSKAFEAADEIKSGRVKFH